MRLTRVWTVEVLEVLFDEPCRNHDAKDPKDQAAVEDVGEAAAFLGL
jgi:hypothetical protein